jgi:hypothetical protein
VHARQRHGIRGTIWRLGTAHAMCYNGLLNIVYLTLRRLRDVVVSNYYSAQITELWRLRLFTVPPACGRWDARLVVAPAWGLSAGMRGGALQRGLGWVCPKPGMPGCACAVVLWAVAGTAWLVMVRSGMAEFLRSSPALLVAPCVIGCALCGCCVATWRRS